MSPDGGASLLGLAGAALLVGIGLVFWLIPRPVRGTRYWTETFSEALDRKDARIKELERENRILRSHMLDTQRMNADSIIRFERENS